MNNSPTDPELRESIATVTATTIALSAAVARDDLTGCDELLAQRGQQFAELDRRLQSATATQLAQYDPELVELAKLDADLQQYCATLRDDLADRCRHAGARKPLHTDSHPVLPICVDRKA